MTKPKVTKRVMAQIEKCVDAYVGRREDFSNLAGRVERDLVENQQLKALIHSTKRREKDPVHLRDKLLRKAQSAVGAGRALDITPENIFESINDLAGVRLLHIHTEQLSRIHPAMVEILNFHKYKLRENPVAYIWDVEREQFLKGLGYSVVVRPSLYTSVHYTVEPHWEAIGCEIQVRTLAEELWGEVSHKINYPHPTDSKACSEQLAVLARIASGCTRLVDSIFTSLKEHEG